jgi:hypothetical protein
MINYDIKEVKQILNQIERLNTLEFDNVIVQDGNEFLIFSPSFLENFKTSKRANEKFFSNNFYHAGIIGTTKDISEIKEAGAVVSIQRVKYMLNYREILDSRNFSLIHWYDEFKLLEIDPMVSQFWKATNRKNSEFIRLGVYLLKAENVDHILNYKGDLQHA